jgi:probable DNA repair protein
MLAHVVLKPMIESFAPVSMADLQNRDSASTLVLTVNNRQARRIIAQLSAGLTQARRVMALPDILPLSAWLRRAGNSLSLRSEAELASHTIDAFGARILWQRVIAEIEADRALLDVAQAARLAMEADRLMSEWRLAVRPEHETSDYQRFCIWRDQYRAKLLAMDAEDGSLGAERVIDAIRNSDADFSFDTVVLAGFNELSPRFSNVLDVMRQRGVQVLVLQPEQFPACRVQRIAAPDPDSEWRLAAQWAAARLRESPEGHYAIVAARLEADAALAHRALREALRTDDFVMPYNVAVARPLAEWPLVRAAIAWLNVLHAFSQDKSCRPAMAGEALLAGACAGHSRESSGRAAIDAMWRKRAEISVSAEAFSDRLSHMAPELARAWKLSLADCEHQQDTAAMDVWAGVFRRVLQSLGFPGQSALDSHAYQVLDAFDQTLDILGRQTTAIGRVGFGPAILLLTQLARETPFQPARDPAARLDVLGILESEGGRWDGVWVLGLTDEILPAVPKPNPFIPLITLRQANAPRATPERELQWAQSMYDALLRCAPVAWVSHAQYEGERELRPSPYIAALPAIMQAQAPSSGQGPCQLETLIDEQGPPLLAGVATHGGIGVIDTQSRNPLWAFVKYRLGASEMMDYADVADQNARGLFLHRAIELVWLMARDQVTLQRIHDQGGLGALVEQSVGQAAQEYLKDYGKVLTRLETTRGIILLNDWLMRELGRKPFIVQDLEKTYLWSYGSLELTVRLDRVDEFADGRLAVIDYKTGSGKIDAKSDWMRQRPVNLQLPFYSAVLASGDASVAALVLARLHAKKIEFQGLADQDYGFDGLAMLAGWPDFANLTWAELMLQWRRTIEQLAQEYSSGVATNRTLHPADLDYCDVLPFLRLNEEDPRVDQAA